MLAKMRPDKLKMHQKAFGTRWGAYSAPPDPLAANKGSYFQGEGREGKGRDREGIGRGREGRKGEGREGKERGMGGNGRGGEGRKGKGKGRTPPLQILDPPRHCRLPVKCLKIMSWIILFLFLSVSWSCWPDCSLMMI